MSPELHLAGPTGAGPGPSAEPRAAGDTAVPGGHRCLLGDTAASRGTPLPPGAASSRPRVRSAHKAQSQQKAGEVNL